MDFINNQKRFNPFFNNESYSERFPKIQTTEVEKLYNNLFNSTQSNAENKVNEFGDQETFKRLFNQTHGHDISNITDLTKDFERKTKRDF
ncbi:MAG TPA: hypothetical protein VIY08_08570 [Candidatus Nitrosocosmicus sp.]